jgi:2-oxoglutarate dehydrogenase E2 component (dihydrolipoamide succinyltransferase)
MAKYEIMMPHMGESIFECTILKWLVKEGDFVTVDDMILEVATDKIDTEIGSSHEGVITKFLVSEGEIAEIGKPICIIDTAQEQIKDENDFLEIESEESFKIEETISQITETIQDNKTDRFLSPLVQSIANQENISKEELQNIKGTGQNQRLTKDDLLEYIESKKSQKIVTPALSNSGDTIVEMDRMRKMIATRMVESKQIAPHVTSFIETDMTKVVKWRDIEKDLFRVKYHHGGLTFTPILVAAVVHAIKKYPGINIQVDGENIIYKKDINIGVAVALPTGNLIVPVVHNADQLSLSDLALKIHDLATRARANKLKPEELLGGTYTISNIGGFGNIAGTPIIMQPQVAIMAFGVIRKMPAVVETAEGDMIAIRQKMIISHGYDHRVIDGSLGGLFLKEVSDYLEKFDTTRTFK